MAELTTTQRNNVRLVESLYGSFTRGDIGAIIEKLAPDIHWQVPDGFPLGGTYEGPNEVRDKFFKRMPEVIGSLRPEIHELVATDDRVYVHLTMHGTTPNGVDHAALAIHSWRIQDGKVIGYLGIGDTAIIDRALRGQT